MNHATIGRVLCASAMGVSVTSLDQPAHAQDSVAQASQSKGILPVPDYAGDLSQRGFLSGGWGDARTDMAEEGIQFNLDWNQYLQGVIDGGRDQTTRYGGNLDYRVNLDLMRMGVLEGAVIKFRAESRYGNSVNGESGAILPVNTDAFFPLTRRLDEDIAFTITDLNYTQFLSPKLAVLLGKANTLSGDPNEFASGRGTTQFMNANFIFNSALALRLPYSTLTAGVVWLPVQEKDHGITVTGLVFNTADSSTTTGFEDFGEGTSAILEADFQYRLGRLPGGQNIGVLYSFDQDFTALSGDLIFVPGQGLVAPTDDDTWAIYWSAWQYVCVEEDVDAPISLENGMPDRQGLGLFARAGIADQDTNPIEWSLSGGIGGRGIIPSRDNDMFGIGYYYTSLQSTRLTGFAGVQDHVDGFEAFYNIAITPAAQLTFDMQMVDSAASSIDTAFILGMRLGLVF
jgi:porin